MNKSEATQASVGLVVVAAVVGYSLSDNVVVDVITYLGVMVGASVGAWIGAERAPRADRLVPRLIAIGISLTALAEVLWVVLDLMGADTDVSIADPAWFASYVFLCAALWVVLSQGVGRVDVDFIIDALTIVTVSVLLFWSFSIESIVSDQSASPFERLVWSGYPIADAVLLGLVMRALMSRTARTVIDAWFAGGVCLWLAADVSYLIAPDAVVHTLIGEAAWMVAPVLMARAAWRFTGIQCDEPRSSRVGGWSTQLTVAVVPLLVPPALELVSDLRGEPDQPLVLITGTTVLITLAFIRTGRLLRSEQRALRELEIARDAALEASRVKSLFLANVSHEIRTPLTTVLAAAEVLGDTPLNELQLGLIAKMHRSGALLRRLVEGILDFSRIEAGALAVTSAPFDLHGMVADLADVYAPRAAQAGIRFESHLTPGVPLTVDGDSGRLFQVLTNLLDNALKFTLEGQVTLTVRAVPADDDADLGERVEFLVADTGIGIREEDLESVFESFSQVDGSITRQYGGSGLGLAICKELTTLMGGSLAVQSRIDTGTTFVIRIPVAHPVLDRTTPAYVPLAR